MANNKLYLSPSPTCMSLLCPLQCQPQCPDKPVTGKPHRMLALEAPKPDSPDAKQSDVYGDHEGVFLQRCIFEWESHSTQAGCKGLSEEDGSGP